LEPLPREQWFVKVRPLADKAIKVVKEGKIKITPKSFEVVYFSWLENLRDWNISRQIVWGIRIPAWLCEKCSNWEVTEGQAPEKCSKCNSKDLVRDADTFDTWFSSGQWPYLTLKTNKPEDFDNFYPTDVMETAYDILKAWVTRMVMLGLYITDEVPFKNVLFHGIVNDPYGKKMSKSKGNVVNPLELVDQYGADAVRFALVYGNATGNDQALSYTKLDAARKFTNKLWNMARFIKMNQTGVMNYEESFQELFKMAKHDNDKLWIEKVIKWSSEISEHIDKYQFNLAAEKLYEYIWHGIADLYVEDVKVRNDKNSFIILNSLFVILLKLLHPFMPFVTEELYKQLGGKKSIMIEHWPENV
jgi:valyl-tRNA synthetase